jgi:TolB-like protein
MSRNQSRISQFWQELKRRKVVRVITVYAAAAFVVLELVSIIVEPLKLPEWLLPVVIILLCVGFIIAVIISWIYDIHPEGGVVKTEPAHKVKAEEIPKSSNTWRIASYISFVVIVGLIALNIFGWKRGARIDESLAKSIAVLPFLNLSGDQEQDYICVGLTDEIISHLFKVRSFDEVRSLTSVLPYREAERNIPGIAEELGVNYGLEGSFKKISDQMRVTAQLIDAKTDNHIWLQDYDLLAEEVVGIPAEIALQIADHLKTIISEDERQRIERIPTTNQEAYDLLQQAGYRSFANKSFAVDSVSLELVLKAIDLAPDYADAYASAGSMIIGLANYGGGREMRTSGWESLSYFEKALELDPYNGSAYSGLAMFYEWFRWDYIEAEKNFIKANELRPGDKSMLQSQYGEFLVKRNRLILAESCYTDKSWFYNSYREIIREIYMGDLNMAAHSLEDFYKQYPESGYYKWIGDLHMRLGQYDSALHYMESAIQAGDCEMMNVPRHQANLALTCHRLGDTIRAQKIINMLEVLSEETSAMSPCYFTGWYYSATGKVDWALYWLENAYRNRSPEIPWLKVDPAFNSLKDDPRYWDLYERTGHKAYDDYMARKEK